MANFDMCKEIKVVIRVTKSEMIFKDVSFQLPFKHLQFLWITK